MDSNREQTIEANPEFLAAIDEADQSATEEGTISLEEARRIVAAWDTK